MADMPSCVRSASNSPVTFLINHGANRHFEDNAFPVFAVAIIPATVAACQAGKSPLVAEAEQGAHAVLRNDFDIAAAPTVAAIRPAARHIFFAAKCNGAVAAFSAGHVDFR